MSRKADKKDAIGFPPPLLGEEPVRMPVLFETEDRIALNKPAGVGVRVFPWDKCPNMDAALNAQLKAGKPELLRRKASLFASVYYLDPVISGIAIFAKNRNALADLRNQFGSEGFRFRFLFVTESVAADIPSGQCSDAPLLRHRVKPKMIPSGKKGKKAFTRFRLLARSPDGWGFGEATVDFFRPHQVRCHAAILEMPLLGDTLYGASETPTQADWRLQKRGSSPPNPTFERVALHLAEVRIKSRGSESTIVCEPPEDFLRVFRRMGLQTDGSGGIRSFRGPVGSKEQLLRPDSG